MLDACHSARTVRQFLVLTLLFSFVLPSLPAAAQAPTAPTLAPAASAAGPAEARADALSAAPINSSLTSAVPCGTSVPSTEVAPLRTRTSRTYQGATGGYQTVVCTNSVNYPDSTGTWQPIDNTLIASTTSGYAYQNAANGFTTLFPSTLTGAPIQVSRGSASVSFALVGAQNATATASGATVSYANALPNVTAAYTVLNDGLKENLTLANATAPSSFTFNVTLSSGLTAQTNSAGGVDFVNSAGVVQLSFAPPAVSDSSTTPAGTSVPATLTMAQAGSSFTVTIAANPTWLASSSRVWPVILDPQVTVNPSADCFIANGSSANTSFCTGTGLKVGYDGTTIYRTLLQFNVSAIPYDATIGDAALQLYLNTASGSGSSTVEARRLTHSWSSPGVTWNSYDGNGNHLWSSPGGDVDSAIADSESVAVSGTGTWSTWGIAFLVQSWVNGTAANNGVLLKESPETTANTFVFNSDRASSSIPALTINWRHWTGLLPYWTYYSHGLTDRSDLSVNVANGNLTFHNRDLTIAGTGLPLSLERFYNSFSNDTQDVGYQWTLNDGLGFSLNSKGNSGVVLNGPSGYSVVFGNARHNYAPPAGTDATLVQNGDATWTLTWHATGLKDNFGVASPNGVSQLTSIVDQNGNKIQIAYNTSGLANGMVNTITDTQNRVVTFSYGTFNGQVFVTQITDSTSRLVKYNYSTDGNHNLTDYYDAANNHTLYTYSGNKLTQIDDVKGNRTKFEYNGSGGALSKITYVTNLSANTGPFYSFLYNRGATPNTVVTDPNNVATTYYYDAVGRVTKIADNAGNSQQFSWTSDNHVATHQDAYQHTTTNTYSTDGNNNLLSTQIPTGVTVRWAYTDASHPFYPTSFTDAQGNLTTYTYDTNGNLKTLTDALASQNQKQLFYNTNGTVDHVIDFNGNTTQYRYDTAGNLTKITPPTTTMPAPGAPLGPITITPDNLSREQVVQDGKGQNTTYSFDNLDRITLTTYNDNSTITTNFDADGNLTSLVDNTGTTSYGYDKLNRKTTKTLPGIGNVCSVTLPDGTVLNGSICYTYDGASNLLSLQDNGGTVSYAYNNLNELITLTEPGSPGPQTAFGYDNNHNRTTTTFPGNTVQTVTYDNSQRVSAMVTAHGTTTLNSLTYSYQNAGADTALVQSVVRSDNNNDNSTTTNSYDALNRLTTWAVTVPSGSALQAHSYIYGYDGNSNRTSINADGNVSTLSYNAANEWTQTTATGYVNPNTNFWDAAGNLLGNDGFNHAAPAQTITYNVKNQLATITDTMTNTIPMSYTGPGEAERVSAGWFSTNTVTPWGNNTFTYGSGTLSQTNSAGIDQGVIHYTYTPDGTLISQRVPGASSNYYYQLSADGSVLRMYDNAGNPIATYVYCPTGNPLPDLTMGPIALNNPYRYLGIYYDAGSKMYYDAWEGGYNDSNSGVWIQLCPLPLSGVGSVLPCLAPFPALSPPQQIPAPESCSVTLELQPGGYAGPTPGTLGFVLQVVSTYVMQQVDWTFSWANVLNPWFNDSVSATRYPDSPQLVNFGNVSSGSGLVLASVNVQAQSSGGSCQARDYRYAVVS